MILIVYIYYYKNKNGQVWYDVCFCEGDNSYMQLIPFKDRD